MRLQVPRRYARLSTSLSRPHEKTSMERTIRWLRQDGEITVGMDEAGTGSSVVLLPALSSISTRAEMRPLFDRLVDRFRVTTVDWPGFGERPRPQEDWSPEILSAFLQWFLSEIISPPHTVIAAGHAATYALYQAVRRPGTIERLVAIAPTWRGPLPTMTGGQRPWFAKVRAAVDQPIVGPALYRLNVSSFVVAKMAREHVYSDPNWLTGERLAKKLAVTHVTGARHSSVRFVTGHLDRVESCAAFLDLTRHANVPVLLVYGDQTPPRSRAEMEALAQLPNVQTRLLKRGKLALHEEFPDEVMDAIMPFLGN